MKKIKIAFFHDAKPFGDKVGSISTYIDHRARILSNNNFEVYWTDGFIVAYFNLSNEQWQMIREYKYVPFIHKFIRRFLIILPGIRFLLNELIIDILEVNDSLRYNIKSIKKKAKVILHVRTSIPIRNILNNIPSSIHSIFNYIGIKRNILTADKIIACSQDIAIYTAGYFKINLSIFNILPHSYSKYVIQNEFDPDMMSNNSFLFIGNYEYVKGIDLLLKAFRIYRDKGGQFSLLIVGPKNFRDVPQKMLKIWDRINKDNERPIFEESELKFIPYLEKKELYNLIKRSNGIIIPSRFESFSMVTAEGILLNTPMIVTEFAGIKDLLIKFDAALIVNPYCEQDLVNAMFKFENESLRNFYIKNTYGLKDYLTGVELINKTVSLYKSVIGH